MKIYAIKRTQVIPATVAEAWEFFSSPNNLGVITPADMDFQIIHKSGSEKMYPGQLILYKVKVLPLIRTTWLTEITHVNEPHYFVDEQRTGPYRLWNHQHRFREVSGGVEVYDEVNYAIPFGPIGQVAQSIFVQRKLNAIFDYRHEAIERQFKKRA